MAELEWRLGEFLVEQGCITMEHLRFATDQEAKTGESRGRSSCGAAFSTRRISDARQSRRSAGDATGAPAVPARRTCPASVGAVGPAAPAVAVAAPPGRRSTGSLGPNDLPMTEAPAQAEEPAGVLDDDDEDEVEKEPDLADFLHAVLDGRPPTFTSRPGCRRCSGSTVSSRSSRATGGWTPKDLQQLIYSMLTQKQREIFEENLELDSRTRSRGRLGSG